MGDYYVDAYPILADVIGYEEEKVPSAVTSYISSLELLPGGSIQTIRSIRVDHNDTVDSSFSYLQEIIPEPDFYISNRAEFIFNGIKSLTFKGITPGQFKSYSLIKMITDEESLSVPRDLVDIIKAIMLETLTVLVTLDEPETFSDYISELELNRVVNNIRWVTKELMKIDGYNFEIIVELRWVERAFLHVMRSKSLFEKDISEIIDDYRNAGGE